MLKKVSVSALALAVTLSVPAALAAQNNPSGTQTGTPNQSSEAPAARGETSQYDAEIEQKLKERFDNDRFQNVKPTVQGQVVTLDGTVRLFAYKQQADERAHDIKHVEMVRNNIQVAGR